MVILPQLLYFVVIYYTMAHKCKGTNKTRANGKTMRNNDNS